MAITTIAADKKALWRYRHAQQCFDYAVTSSDRIMREKWSLDHPLIYQMSIAVVVLYVRPFTNCHGLGHLDEQFVPSAYRSKHKRLVAMRHRVFAHYDITEAKGLGTPDLAAEMRFSVVGRELVIELKETPLLAEAFAQISEVSKVLEKKCRWHIEKIMNRYKKEVPSNSGNYKFDLRDEKRFFGDRA